VTTVHPNLPQASPLLRLRSTHSCSGFCLIPPLPPPIPSTTSRLLIVIAGQPCVKS